MIRKWIVDTLADVLTLHVKLYVKIAAIIKELRSHTIIFILFILELINLIFILLWIVFVPIIDLILLWRKPNEYLENTMNDIYEMMTNISQRG